MPRLRRRSNEAPNVVLSWDCLPVPARACLSSAVFTDHATLQWLSSAQFSNCKLERWALSLQEYSFAVEQVKGKNNVVADCLSRLTAAPTMTTKTAQYWPQATTNKVNSTTKIPCGVCDDDKGYDNNVICDACDACYHLRRLVPPQSTTPLADAWIFNSATRAQPPTYRLVHCARIVRK